MADEQAKRDPNYVTTLLAVSNVDGASTVRLWADPTTHRLLVDVNGALGTSSVDDSAFTAASGSGIPVMGFVTSDSVDNGDVGVLKMLANRQLAVTLFDSGGTELSVGGGTQYTEDAAAAANPVGTVPMLVRKDTPAGEVSADGDNVAQRGTNYGAAYVTILDASGNAVSIGGGTQYTEDAAAAANPVGNMLMGVRADALAGKTSADGDNVAASMTDKGELYVKHADAIAVTNAGLTELAAAINASSQLDINIAAVGTTLNVANTGTFAVQVDGNALTALQLIDDIVHANDAAISKVAAIGAQFDDTAPGTTTENSVRALRMSTRRELYTQIRDAAGNERGANVNASNELLVALSSVPSHAVTNAGTFAVQVDGAALTALQKIDDPVIVDDAAFTPATSSVMMAGFTFDDVAPDSVNEGDAGAARMSANRNIYTTIRDAAGNERGANVDASGQLAIAGPVTNAGTFVTQENGAALTSLQLMDDAIVADDAAFTPATTKVMMAGFEYDDTSPDSVNEGDGGAARMSANRNIYTTIRDAAGNERGLNVDASGNISITTVTTVTTVSTLTGGGIAHDSADSGNPHKIGFKAYSPDGTTPGTAVAEGDRTDAKSDLDGRQYVNGEHPRHWSYHEDSSSALTDTSVQADPGDGFEIVITEICVSTGAATALNFFLEEGSTKVFGPIYLEAVAGRGFVWRGNKHITASTAVTITTSAAIAHSIDIQGYIQAV